MPSLTRQRPDRRPLCVDHGPESGGHARRPSPLSQKGGRLYQTREVTHAATGHAGLPSSHRGMRLPSQMSDPAPCPTIHHRSAVAVATAANLSPRPRRWSSSSRRAASRGGAWSTHYPDDGGPAPANSIHRRPIPVARRLRCSQPEPGPAPPILTEPGAQYLHRCPPFIHVRRASHQLRLNQAGPPGNPGAGAGTNPAPPAGRPLPAEWPCMPRFPRQQYLAAVSLVSRGPRGVSNPLRLG